MTSTMTSAVTSTVTFAVTSTVTSNGTFAADDRCLTEALCRRDEKALNSVYGLYKDRVFEVVRHVVVDRRAAEDVTQEVFLYVWRNADRIDLSRGGLRAFIVTVARRRAIDHVRSEVSRRRREERVTARTLQNGSHPAQPDFSDEVVARSSDAQRAAGVRAALLQLAEAERVAIDLAYFRGHTLRQVAVATNSPEGTTKARVRRALRHLQENANVQAAHRV